MMPDKPIVIDTAHVLKKLFPVIMDARQRGIFFSLFSVLGIHEKELAHSKFICAMLDPAGSHGQSRRYLEIFLSTLQRHLPSSCSIGVIGENDRVSVVSEEYVGQVDINNIAGGRIDIVIRYGTRAIFIENKIYAEDQPLQLIRYHRNNPEAILLYLTPYGAPASEQSTGTELKLDKDYFCISYQHIIKDWIKSCIDISSELPEIALAFKSYDKCVNEIIFTWSDNLYMQLIDKIIAPDTIQPVMELLSMKDDILYAIRIKAIQQLDEIAFELGLTPEYNIDSVFKKENSLFGMTCNTWGDVAIGMGAAVDAKNENESEIRRVFYCIHSKSENPSLRGKIDAILNSEWPKDRDEIPSLWPYYKYLEGKHCDWTLDSPIWNDIVIGSFKSSAKIELEKMKMILDQIIT